MKEILQSYKCMIAQSYVLNTGFNSAKPYMFKDYSYNYGTESFRDASCRLVVKDKD